MTYMTRGLATAGILLAFGLPAAAQTEVKIGYALAPDSHYGVAAQKFEEVVTAETDGAFTFQHFPSSGLGGEREVIEGLQIGTIEATIVSSGTLANFVPETGVFDIPFLFRDLGHARATLDGPIGQDILAKFDDVGLHGLAWGEQGFRHITNNRNPIHTPADVEGLKLRTMENPVHLAAFNAMGAAPTPMAWPEVVSSLQQGVIDGQENPLSVVKEFSFNEVQEFVSLTNHVYTPITLAMAGSAWDALSAEEQAALTAAAKAGAEATRVKSDESDASLVAEFEAAGMKVNTPDLAAFKEAAAPLRAEFAAIVGEEFLAEVEGSLK